MANEHWKSIPTDCLFRCKTLVDVLATGDLIALQTLARGWGCVVHNDFQRQAQALAQHAQGETHRRLQAWADEKARMEKLGRRGG